MGINISFWSRSIIYLLVENFFNKNFFTQLDKWLQVERSEGNQLIEKWVFKDSELIFGIPLSMIDYLK